VAIFAGIGCSGARDEVLTLGARVHAPIGHTLRGKDLLQHDNPFDVGMTGLLGHGACYRALHEADLVLLLGTDFPYDDFLPDARTIQIDIDPARLGRRTPLVQGIAADVGHTLRALLPLLEQRTDRHFLDDVLHRHEKAIRHAVETYTRDHGQRTPMHRSTSPGSSTRPLRTTPCSPSTPGCAARGPPATSPRPGGAGSWARSCTARWPTPSPWRSGRRSPHPAARSCRSPATVDWPCSWASS
jgi:hypothetical protein